MITGVDEVLSRLTCIFFGLEEAQVVEYPVLSLGSVVAGPLRALVQGRCGRKDPRKPVA